MQKNRVYKDIIRLLGEWFPVIIFLSISLLERQLYIFSLEGKLGISHNQTKIITIFSCGIYFLMLCFFAKLENNKKRIHHMIIYISYLVISSLFVKEYMYYDFTSIRLLFKMVYGPLGIVLDPLTFLFDNLNNVYRSIIIFHFFFFVLIRLLRKYFGIIKKTTNWIPYAICYCMCLGSLIGGIENPKVQGLHMVLTIGSAIGWGIYFMKDGIVIKTKKLWSVIGIMILVIKVIALLNYVVINYKFPFTGILMVIDMISDKFFSLNVMGGEWISLGIVVFLCIMYNRKVKN